MDGAAAADNTDVEMTVESVDEDEQSELYIDAENAVMASVPKITWIAESGCVTQPWWHRSLHFPDSAEQTYPAKILATTYTVVHTLQKHFMVCSPTHIDTQTDE